MKTLNLILKDPNFEKLVISYSLIMGMDEALYFTIGQYQSKCNDFDDDFFQDDDIIEKIINKYPSLEF